MNEKIIKQIKTLPPLPKGILKIQKITNDPNSSISDLVKVINEDLMLTANLLKAANSPLYGFRDRIKNVDHVISLFRMATIKFDLSAYGIEEEDFYEVFSKRDII